MVGRERAVDASRTWAYNATSGFQSPLATRRVCSRPGLLTAHGQFLLAPKSAVNEMAITAVDCPTCIFCEEFCLFRL